ncbi:MAG: TatD family hydrolase [Eggerthellaceae bacterium]|nr:TatD family hydrolase [Eggerthellaceae bacterium]
MHVASVAIDPDGPAGHLIFRVGLFYKKNKSGFTLVPTPEPPLELSLADAHVHLDTISDPVLSLARCSVARVDFLVTIVDVAENGDTTYNQLDEWKGAALRMAADVFQATQDHLRRLPLDVKPPAEGMSASDAEISFRCGRNVHVPQVRIACGVHPHNAKLYNDEVEALLRRRLADARTCAVGEVGLDYHYDLSEREVQKEVFRKQIALAHETGLPLMLHVREAHEDALEILDKEGIPHAGMHLHCITISPDKLRPWIERDAYVSFGGALTFNKSDQIRESLKIAPQSRLLLETDAPFMTPVPFRGQECGPEHIIYTAAYASEVLGAQAGDNRATLLSKIHANTLALYDRPATLWQEIHG